MKVNPSFATIMTSTVRSKDVPKTPSIPNYTIRVDVYLAGYLFTEEQVRRLCIDAYGLGEEYVDHLGPLDACFLYFHRLAALDSPGLVEVYNHYLKGTRIAEGYILPCRLAIVNRRSPPPDLSPDEKSRAYTDHWFPPHIRQAEPFKNVPYVCLRYPKHEIRARLLFSYTLPKVT